MLFGSRGAQHGSVGAVGRAAPLAALFGPFAGLVFLRLRFRTASGRNAGRVVWRAHCAVRCNAAVVPPHSVFSFFAFSAHAVLARASRTVRR